MKKLFCILLALLIFVGLLLLSSCTETKGSVSDSTVDTTRTEAPTTSFQEETESRDPLEGIRRIDETISAQEFRDFLNNEAKEKDLPYLVDPDAINVFNGELQKVRAEHNYFVYNPSPYDHDYVVHTYHYLVGNKKVFISYSNNNNFDFEKLNFSDHTGNDLSSFPGEIAESQIVWVDLGKAAYSFVRSNSGNSLSSIVIKIDERWQVTIHFFYDNECDENDLVKKRLLNKETAPAQIDEIIALFDGLLKES